MAVHSLTKILSSPKEKVNRKVVKSLGVAMQASSAFLQIMVSFYSTELIVTRNYVIQTSEKK